MVCSSLLPYGKASAIIISATLFSIMHANIEQLLYTFVAGIFLALIYVESKNIVYPMLLHFLNNGKSVLLNIILQNTSSVEYSRASLIIDMAILLLCAISLIIVLLKILKNSKENSEKTKENQHENVQMLTKCEKASGFLSIGMICYFVYSFATVIKLIFDSLV